MARCPLRKKNFFQAIIYCVRTLARLQLSAFIEQAEYLHMSLDGAQFESGAKVFGIVLFDENLNYKLWSLDACTQGDGPYLFDLTMSMLSDFKEIIFSK